MNTQVSRYTSTSRGLF